jgi:Flp pilus assembly protein TadD
MFLNDAGVFCRLLLSLLFSSGLLLFQTSPAAAQSSVNPMGNGGSNSIQGRLVIQNGKRVDTAGLTIRLRSPAGSDLTLLTDGTGGFAFKNLVGGQYTVTVEGGDLFEQAQEDVVIDDVGSSSISDRRVPTGVGRPYQIQMYLHPKAATPTPAADVLEVKIAEAPKSAQEKYREAKTAMAANDIDAAITSLREAVAIFPGFSIAWNDLGILLGRKGETAASVQAFRSAVKSDVTSVPALIDLGCALVETHNYTEAETYLAAGLSKDPSQFIGHYYLGVAEAKLGRLEIAEQALLKAIELGGGRVTKAHYVLGGVYWAEKKYDKAAAELERYLAANPKAPDAEQTKKAISDLRSKKT